MLQPTKVKVSDPLTEPGTKGKVIQFERRATHLEQWHGWEIEKGTRFVKAYLDHYIIENGPLSLTPHSTLIIVVECLSDDVPDMSPLLVRYHWAPDDLVTKTIEQASREHAQNNAQFLKSEYPQR